VINSNGELLVMWRNWLEGSRDMYLTRSIDGATFSKPEKLGQGTWKLNACPMDGGGIVISQGKIVTLWRREHDLFLATAGKPETRIATGIDAAIASGSDGIYAIWSAASNIQAITPGKSQPIDLAAKGSFPTIAALPGRVGLAAWEEDGGITIRQIP
jgi:hypothetical protein